MSWQSRQARREEVKETVCSRPSLHHHHHLTPLGRVCHQTSPSSSPNLYLLYFTLYKEQWLPYFLNMPIKLFHSPFYLLWRLKRPSQSVKLTILYFSSSEIENIHRGAERGKWNPEQKVLIFPFLSIFHHSRQVNGNFAKTGFEV